MYGDRLRFRHCAAIIDDCFQPQLNGYASVVNRIFH